MKVIDAHSHFLPQEVVDALRGGNYPLGWAEERSGKTWIVTASGLEFPLIPLHFDIETKLRWMDERGIDISLSSASAPFFLHDLTPEAEMVAFHRSFNDAAASMQRESDGRLTGVASVPITLPDQAALELRRACSELGLRGVEIGTSVGEVMLDDPSLEPFFAAAEQLRMPVFLHPYTFMLGPGTMPGFDRFFLQNLVGNGLETQIAAARLTLGGVFDRFPELKIQLSHGGGAFPYHLARFDHTYRHRANVSESSVSPPSAYLRNFLFDTIVHGEQQLQFLLALAGPDNIVFGTDHPFDIHDMYGFEFASSQDRDTAEKILGGNAEREYGLASG